MNANLKRFLSVVAVTGGFLIASGIASAASISGSVRGAVAGGVTVVLSGPVSKRTKTAANGTYKFTGLPRGAYTIKPMRTSYAFTPARVSVKLANVNVTGKNFTSKIVYNVSGTVGGAISSGVTVSLTGPVSRTTSTDANGAYRFTGLPKGTYTLRPSRAGYVFTPSSSTVTLSGSTIQTASVTGKNFTSTIIGGTTAGGTIASDHTTPIPGNVSVTNFAVTNQGLYMQSVDGTKVLKLHGNPIFNSWSLASPAEFLWDYAPANIYSEQDGEVSFYWTDRDDFGLYGANNGVPSFRTEQDADDFSDDMGISRVAAGGREGIAAPRPWVIAQGLGNINFSYQYLFQDDGQYTAAKTPSDYFGQPAGFETVDPEAILLAHPTDGTLFVGDGNILHVYSSSGRLSSTEVAPSQPSTRITQLVWYHGELWIAYGSAVLRRSADGIITEFTRVDANYDYFARMMLPGLFCIRRGGDVLTIDGMAKSVNGGDARSWISTGTLNNEQQLKAILLQASLTGIFCSPDNMGGWVYSWDAATNAIRMINPVN